MLPALKDDPSLWLGRCDVCNQVGVQVLSFGDVRQQGVRAASCRQLCPGWGRGGRGRRRLHPETLPAGETQGHRQQGVQKCFHVGEWHPLEASLHIYLMGFVFASTRTARAASRCSWTPLRVIDGCWDSPTTQSLAMDCDTVTVWSPVCPFFLLRMNCRPLFQDNIVLLKS